MQIYPDPMFDQIPNLLPLTVRPDLLGRIESVKVEIQDRDLAIIFIIKKEVLTFLRAPGNNYEAS